MATKRTDKTEIEKVEGTPAGAASFLATYAQEDTSLATLGEHMVVPRFKMVHPMSDPELIKRFPPGTCIIRPGDAVVLPAGSDDTFKFVPQLFFVEYCKWSDRRDKASQAIMERSYDASSDIAKRAADAQKRFEYYPDQQKKPEKDKWVIRYVQHFCFPGVIYGDHSLAGTPVVMSFEKGEFGNGRAFIGACNMRREDDGSGTGNKIKVPLWAQVWQMKVGFRKNDQGSWYGFDFSGAGTITAEEAPEFRDAHLNLAKLHAENRLRVDHGNDVESEPVEQEPDGVVAEGDTM